MSNASDFKFSSFLRSSGGLWPSSAPVHLGDEALAAQSYRSVLVFRTEDAAGERERNPRRAE